MTWLEYLYSSGVRKGLSSCTSKCQPTSHKNNKKLNTLNSLICS